MALIYAYQSRGITKILTIQDGAGVTIVPGNNDKIRIIIGYESKLDTDPLLVVASDAPTENGSSILKNTPSSGQNQLRLDASDLQLIPAGTYCLAVDFFDNADAQEWKNVSRQTFCLEAT